MSRVLNGLPTRDDTVRRVMAAADELGYVPNSVARSLRSNRTNQVAFAMADIGNPTYVAMVRAMQPVLKDAGYRLVLHSTDADIADELDVLRRLGERYVDGLIISPLRVTERHLERSPRRGRRSWSSARSPRARPSTTYAPTRAPACGSPWTTCTPWAAAGSASSTARSTRSPARRAPGVRGRARRARPALRRGRSSRSATSTARTAPRAARRLLARTRPDALMCANDLIALGALDVLRAEGCACPRTSRVVGIDDTDLARAAWPTLTSVALGSAERGRRAAELMLDRLADGDAGPRVVTVEPRLTVRASTGGSPMTAVPDRRSAAAAGARDRGAAAPAAARARTGTDLQRRPAAVRDLPVLHGRARRPQRDRSPSSA